MYNCFILFSDVPYTSPTGKFKVIQCDMSLYLQERMISIIIPAIEEGGEERKIARRIKMTADKEHNPTWHCVVGENFGSLVNYEVGYFLHVKYDAMEVMLWKYG